MDVPLGACRLRRQSPRVGLIQGSALRASTGVFYNFAGSSSAQGFQYAYAGGCPVSCTRTIRWAKFEDIAAASTGGTNFVESPTNGTVGDYSWNGANGTSWWNDPQEKLVVVTMTAAPGDIRKYYREQMAALVYGAMER